MTRDDLQQILSSTYNAETWRTVLREIFGATNLRQTPNDIKNRLSGDDGKIAKPAFELGSFETADGRAVGLYQIDLTTIPQIWRNRVGLRNLLRNIYRNDVDAALVVFVQGNKWRLSLISEIKVIDADGNAVDQKTEPKRYTYLLGTGETVRTPVERLHDLQTSDRKLAALIKAFSVEALNKDFFREYKIVFDDLAAETDRSIKDKEISRLFAQRLLNRLMFLYFIQKKDWMKFDGDTNYLRSLFDEAKRRKQKFYRDRLYYVFFYGLSNHAESREIHNQAELEAIRGQVPYLNGGLFEPEKDGLDEKGKVPLSNDIFEEILKLFERYNFTVDESTPFEVQVAVDPEMLGKVFEELVTGRHESGSYYTPRTVVSFMCREALKHALEGIETSETIAELVDDNDGRSVKNPEGVLGRLKELKICDPACGSGAYLLGMLQELLHVREALFASTATAKDAQYKWKREIIENSIYGVDIDRFATQIAALRLWLSLAIESDVPHPLPNLKYKIGCGDSLIAPIETVGQGDLHRRALIEQFRARKQEYTDADTYPAKAAAEAEIERLRVEIARNLNRLPEPPSPAKLIFARKHVAAMEADVTAAVKEGNKTKAELAQKKLNDLLAEIARLEAQQTVDHYDSGNTFDWSVEFAEVFENGGFDIILANPPYIRQENITNKPALKDRFKTYDGRADIYVYFYERAIELLKAGGSLVFISSNKFLRAKYGRLLRSFISNRCVVSNIIDFGELPVFENASTFPMVFCSQKRAANDRGETLYFTRVKSLHAPYPDLKLVVASSAVVLSQEEISGTEWKLFSNRVGSLIEKLTENNQTLKEIYGSDIYSGIKTGLNRAFWIDHATKEALVTEDPKSESIIKRLARGDDIRKWHIRRGNLFIIYTTTSINIDDFPAVRRISKNFDLS